MIRYSQTLGRQVFIAGKNSNLELKIYEAFSKEHSNPKRNPSAMKLICCSVCSTYNQKTDAEKASVSKQFKDLIKERKIVLQGSSSHKKQVLSFDLIKTYSKPLVKGDVEQIKKHFEIKQIVNEIEKICFKLKEAQDTDFSSQITQMDISEVRKDLLRRAKLFPKVFRDPIHEEHESEEED